MKVYFAHQISDYNTEFEKKCLAAIRRHFEIGLNSSWEIVNPNDKVHENAYRQIGMSYFRELARQCDICVAVPFKSNRYGMGVFSEIQAMAEQGKNILTVDRDDFGVYELAWRSIAPLSVEQTRKRVKKEREENEANR
jgi:hypothetical protein